MAGHSKWANIKHKKAAVDKKRGKIWTKLIREITVAARMGGGDINANPRLRLAVDKGLGANMPKDTIERAIKRGSGDTDGENYDEIRYEGYGPGGTAVMVDCMTDNRNRTASEVRHAFSKLGAIWVPTARSAICSPSRGSSVSPREQTRSRSWSWPWKRVPRM